jgi:hypothetical protein
MRIVKRFVFRCGGTSKRRLMTAAQFVEFLNKTQRDPRLNEILYPYANNARAKDLIQQYEPNKYNAQRGINFCDFCKSVCCYYLINLKNKLTMVV